MVDLSVDLSTVLMVAAFVRAAVPALPLVSVTGIVLIVAGALALQPSIPNVVKVVLIVVVHLASSAVGTMAIARATYITRTPLEHFEFDELAEATPKTDAEEDKFSEHN